MRIQKLRIRNFRAIKNMVLDNLENALILVGKNSTGKQPYWKLSAGFWMIRDGDGKNADELRHRLCRYYEERKKEDVKEYMEEIKIYLRGHNLFDIFYGPYKSQEQEILNKYVELAPREEFQDILDAIDLFIYFENRKKEHE